MKMHLHIPTCANGYVQVPPHVSASNCLHTKHTITLHRHPLIITAVVRTHKHPLPRIAAALQHKLLVRPVHTQTYRVFPSIFHIRYSHETVSVAHFHGQSTPCFISYHGRHLGRHQDNRYYYVPAHPLEALLQAEWPKRQNKEIKGDPTISKVLNPDVEAGHLKKWNQVAFPYLAKIRADLVSLEVPEI